jgi:hypothetical protein
MHSFNSTQVKASGRQMIATASIPEFAYLLTYPSFVQYGSAKKSSTQVRKTRIHAGCGESTKSGDAKQSDRGYSRKECMAPGPSWCVTSQKSSLDRYMTSPSGRRSLCSPSRISSYVNRAFIIFVHSTRQSSVCKQDIATRKWQSGRRWQTFKSLPPCKGRPDAHRWQAICGSRFRQTCSSCRCRRRSSPSSPFAPRLHQQQV